MSGADAKAVKVGWQRSYKAALDADVWGQADEAQAAYTQLAQAVMDLLPHSPPQARPARSALWSGEEVTALLRFRHCLLCRAQTLSFNAGRILEGLEGGEEAKGEAEGRASGHRRRATAAELDADLSLDDMQRLTAVLDELLTGATSAFPVALDPAALDGLTAHPGRAAQTAEAVISVCEEKQSSEGEQSDGRGGSLQPPGAFAAGSTSVTLHLLRIGLKDAAEYVNPHLSVVVAGPQGPAVEVQDTAFLALSSVEPRHLHLGCAVHLQTPLERMTAEHLSVFLELRHWKASKKKVSARCFALLEADEARRAAARGPVALELYRKPTDYQKKRLTLLSIKPLYLHLNVALRTH